MVIKSFVLLFSPELYFKSSLESGCKREKVKFESLLYCSANNPGGGGTNGHEAICTPPCFLL